MRCRLSLLPTILVCAAVFSTRTQALETEAPAVAAERVRLESALFPPAPESDEVFTRTLAAAKDAGFSGQRLLEAEVFRALTHRVKSSDLASLASRLEVAAPGWSAGDAVVVDRPELAGALVHALRALVAKRAGDETTFRSEGALAVWAEPPLSGLVADFELSVRREVLLTKPEFVALTAAVAACDEPAARKTFAAAYWAEPPLSCELATERLAALRAALDTPAVASSRARPARGVMAFAPVRATTPRLTLFPDAR